MEVRGSPRQFTLNFKPKINNDWGIVNYHHKFDTNQKWTKIKFPFATAKYAVLEHHPVHSAPINVTDLFAIQLAIKDQKYEEPFLLSIRHMHGYH